MAMTSRERVITALNRRTPDRVPWTIESFSPSLERALRVRAGADDLLEYFQVDIRIVGLGEAVDPDWSRKEACFRQYYTHLPAGTVIDRWGLANVPGDYYHFYKTLGPMGSFTSLEELEAYPWPDLAADYRVERMRQRLQELHDQDLAVAGGYEITIFETAWALRGYDRFFLDLVEFPEFAHALLDKITELRRVQARAYAEAGVDVFMVADDVSMQTGMMMSPATWRRWFKSRTASIIATARAILPDVPVWFHSDGNPEAIVPDLLEIDVNVLNPVQPECVDPAKLKQLYGDRLAFWGTIGIQTTMPFGTADDVRWEVKERMETVGVGGGLLLAPTHMLEPEVPIENVFALAEAIETYGRYQ